MSTSGDHFVDFWSQGQNASNRAFWSSFCRLLEPRPECLKSSLLELILSTSGAKAGKCLNQAFWKSFCRLLEPRPESSQIDASGSHFVDFWSQGQKVLKSRCRSIILRRLYDTWQFQGVILLCVFDTLESRSVILLSVFNLFAHRNVILRRVYDICDFRGCFSLCF